MSLQDSLKSALNLLTEGRDAEAEASLSQLARAHNNVHKVHQLHGVVLGRLGRLEEAEKALQRAVKLAPSDAETLNSFGNARRAMSNIEGSVAPYSKAIEVNEVYAPAYQNLVSSLIDLGRFDEAANALVQWQVNVPVSPQMLEARGRLFKEQGFYEEAEKAFQEALYLKPDSAVALFGRAGCFIEFGRFSEVIRVCEGLLSAGVVNAEVYYLLGRACLENGDAESAQKNYVLAVQRGSEEALKDLLNLIWMTGQRMEAKALALDVLSADQAAAGQKIIASQQLLEMDEGVACLDYFKSNHQADDAGLTLMEIRAMHQTAQYSEAFRCASQHHQLAERDPNFGYLYAVCAFAVGEYDLALQIVLSWREKQPLDQTWLALQATAQRVMGLDEYKWLYDYQKFVVAQQLFCPEPFETLDKFHEVFVDHVHGGTQFQTHPLGQSLRDGVQSRHGLTKDSSVVVQAYLKALKQPIQRYVNQIGCDTEHPYTSRNTGDFELYGVWSVKLHSGGKHVNHVHPEGWISSSYYLQLPDEVEDENLRSGWIKFGEPPFYTPDTLEAEYWVKPEVGRLVLFPSYMWHGTEPIRDGSERVTAPFDVIPARMRL